MFTQGLLYLFLRLHFLNKFVFTLIMIIIIFKYMFYYFPLCHKEITKLRIPDDFLFNLQQLYFFKYRYSIRRLFKPVHLHPYFTNHSFTSFMVQYILAFTDLSSTEFLAQLCSTLSIHELEEGSHCYPMCLERKSGQKRASET